MVQRGVTARTFSSLSTLRETGNGFLSISDQNICARLQSMRTGTREARFSLDKAQTFARAVDFCAQIRAMSRIYMKLQSVTLLFGKCESV
jgi:hypothetical protein